MTGEKTLNLVLKMLEVFVKIQENIRISILKRRLRNLSKKENFKSEIKAMNENLQDGLSQLENKQARSVKLCDNIRWELEAKNAPKLSSNWKTEYAKSNNIWIIYTDDINQNILAVLRTLSNLQKRIYEKLYTKETTSKAATTEFLGKIPDRKKISNEDFNLCKAETSLDEISKSLFSNK